MPLQNWYNCGTNHFEQTSVVLWKWKTQPAWVIKPVTHDLVRRIRFGEQKSPEHDFKYLYWTISKMLSWNVFTCEGTYMTDWVGRICIYIYVHIYICIYIYIHTCIYMYMHILVHMHICEHMHTHTHTNIWHLYTCIHVYTYICWCVGGCVGIGIYIHVICMHVICMYVYPSHHVWIANPRRCNIVWASCYGGQRTIYFTNVCACSNMWIYMCVHMCVYTLYIYVLIVQIGSGSRCWCITLRQCIYV